MKSQNLRLFINAAGNGRSNSFERITVALNPDRKNVLSIDK